MPMICVHLSADANRGALAHDMPIHTRAAGYLLTALALSTAAAPARTRKRYTEFSVST